jgi:hypothetical protein
MKSDLRVSVKDYPRNKNPKIRLSRVPFSRRQFWVRMNGSGWPKDFKVALKYMRQFSVAG